VENKPQQTDLAPIFGFDIGIASVGWAVLAPNRIIALGVRAFDKAETAKEGDPLNKVRRDARLVRRRLRRRAWRLKKLARLLKRHGLVGRLDEVRSPLAPATSPWQLRVEALDRCLGAGEWAAVIYHICKHRGFHWISRADERKAESDAKGEDGKVKQGLAGTARLMQERGYRTAAEMVLAEFPDAQRNKRGEYRKALARKLLGEELRLLFRRQRDLGNSQADSALEAEVLGTGDGRSGLFWQQKPALSGAALLKMLGRCTFEKEEYRAPKASFTAERHVWLTRLNNLRLAVDGRTRPLTPAERAIALPLPYQQAGDFKYRQLRAALVKAGLTEDARFAGLPYPSDAQVAEGKAKDPEDATLVKLPAWQALRSTLKKAGLETEWHGLAAAALDGRPEALDAIGYVLSVFKDDDEVRAELRQLALPGAERMIEALLDLRFDGFHSLSLKALRRIVPLMADGLRYDEACEQAGYRHSQPNVSMVGKQKYLPPLYSGRSKNGRMVLDADMDVPRNPVVLRALNQARKVLNALVRAYGAPAEVHIEMARDLSRPLDERRKIEKEQTEYRERNERDRGLFVEHFGREPKGAEFEKWRLYREQQGKCAYSVEALDIARLLEEGYVEIDHALPYSRSFDDSKNNKVLVLARENRDKGNRTPYEYLGGAEQSPRWRQFVAFVESNKAYRLAKRNRLLRKNFDADEAGEFRERNLNDTRYICRFFKNYVEQHLQLAAGSDAKSCVVVNGQLTAFLRARWGLLKNRAESDRHHALDAAVVAACTRGMVKALADYARRRELESVHAGFVDLETGEVIDPAAFARLERRFPVPWPHFRQELETRLTEDDPAQLRSALAALGTYPPAALDTVRPLFVSRAPQRRSGGAAHKETVYGRLDREDKAGAVTQKVPLSSLTMKDIDNLIDPHRNARLYAAIRARLEAHSGKAEKVFPPDNPLRKPDRAGNPTGPIVRTVTLVIDKLSGIPVRGGVAKNDAMLRVDVFSKGGKFYLVPVYVHHRVKGLPNRAIAAFKDEDQWTAIDGNFDFRFSIHQNDLVRIRLKNDCFLGYYAGCDRSTGAVSLWTHDRNQRVGKDGLIRGIGAKTALAIEKLHVDCLGNIYPAPPEVRRGLA
jgi:CRISPR-associated endonuclease Csn1